MAKIKHSSMEFRQYLGRLMYAIEELDAAEQEDRKASRLCREILTPISSYLDEVSPSDFQAALLVQDVQVIFQKVTKGKDYSVKNRDADLKVALLRIGLPWDDRAKRYLCLSKREISDKASSWSGGPKGAAFEAVGKFLDKGGRKQIEARLNERKSAITLEALRNLIVKNNSPKGLIGQEEFIFAKELNVTK